MPGGSTMHTTLTADRPTAVGKLAFGAGIKKVFHLCMMPCGSTLYYN